jgi:hypothetical protein
MKSRRFTAQERLRMAGDCYIHPTVRPNEMSAMSPPIFFSKEVALKQATLLPRQDLPHCQKSFRAKFSGMASG